MLSITITKIQVFWPDNMPRSTHKCLNIYYPSKATPIKFPVSHHIEGIFQCARAEHKHKHKTQVIGERSTRIALLYG